MWKNMSSGLSSIQHLRDELQCRLQAKPYSTVASVADGFQAHRSKLCFLCSCRGLPWRGEAVKTARYRKNTGLSLRISSVTVRQGWLVWTSLFVPQLWCFPKLNQVHLLPKPNQTATHMGLLHAHVLGHRAAIDDELDVRTCWVCFGN